MTNGKDDEVVATLFAASKALRMKRDRVEDFLKLMWSLIDFPKGSALSIDIPIRNKVVVINGEEYRYRLFQFSPEGKIRVMFTNGISRSEGETFTEHVEDLAVPLLEIVEEELSLVVHSVLNERPEVAPKLEELLGVTGHTLVFDKEVLQIRPI